MNLKNLVLGLAALLALGAVIVLQVIYVSDAVNYAAWAVFLGLTGLWLVLNRSSVLQFFTRKSTRYGANIAFVIFLVLGIMVFANVLAKQHPMRKDVTRSGLNTLSDQSQKIVSGLSQDVKAYLFTSLNEKDTGESLLKRYQYLSKRFQFEFVDVDRRPTQAQAMGVKRKGAVVLSLGETNKRVMVDQPSEEAITNGLIKLLRSNEISVYFTVGHDEHPLSGDSLPLGYSALKGELEKQGYVVKDLNLFNTGRVPDDAAVVVVAGPKRAFFPKELEILEAWINGGGHALLAVNLDVDENGLAKGSKQIAEIAKKIGVEVIPQMLVDPTSKVANVEPQVLLGFSGSKEHPVTKDFAHSSVVANFLFPLTAYLRKDEKAANSITPLVNTTPQAWAESDWASLKRGKVTFDKGQDHQGQMDLAYAVEGKKPEGQSQPSARALKVAVFANAIFASNNLLDKVGNRDLILNAISWLADEDRFLSIRAKEDPDALKPYSNNLINLILLLSVFLIPISLIGAGTFVWWRRSKL